MIAARVDSDARPIPDPHPPLPRSAPAPNAMDDGFLDLAFPSTQQQYETLDEIDDELARGELHAFGRPDQRWAIMEHVELIKSKQLEIFDQLTNMELP